MAEEKEWVPVRDTMLATEINPRIAGRLLSQAGFKRVRIWDSEAKINRYYTEARAEYLTKAEVEGLILFKRAGATVPNENAPGEALKKAKQFIQSSESSLEAQLIEVCEQQDKVINELRDEVRQLRQHIAQLQHRNGLGERAKKALSTARQTLSLVKGD